MTDKAREFLDGWEDYIARNMPNEESLAYMNRESLQRFIAMGRALCVLAGALEGFCRCCEFIDKCPNCVALDAPEVKAVL